MRRIIKGGRTGNSGSPKCGQGYDSVTTAMRPKSSFRLVAIPKQRYIKHGNAKDVPVFQPDTRVFKGTKVTQAQINEHIAKHGITYV